MSLINDALKRASVQREAVAAPPVFGGPLPAVVEHGRSIGAVPVILCIVGIGAMLMAGGFWLKSKAMVSIETQTVSHPEPRSVARTETSKPQPALPTSTLSAVPVPSPTAVPVIPAQTSSLVAAATVPTTAAEPVSPDSISATQTQQASTPSAAVGTPYKAAVEAKTVEQPRRSTYRLQAIYYRMKGPTVLINGKTLRLGDTIDGAKLVSIERTAAEIDVGGVRQRLTTR